MKIAMIGQKGIPAIYGGVEKHVHDLALRLAKNHDIYVYSRKWYTKIKENSYQGVNIVHTPTIHTKHLDAISHTFTSTIHALFQGYDIIHYHGVGPSLLSWIPRIFAPKTKVVNTFHSIDRYHQKWNFFAKFMLRLGEKAACTFAHETIAVSESIKQYCQNEYNIAPTYIPNGVNKIEKKIGQDNLKQFNLEKNKYFVFVSRLVPHKGAHLLIEAFQNLKKNNPKNNKIQNLKLAIVGGSAYTDDYIKQLHEQAKNNNDIIFTDFQSGDILDELYANSLALVHPSLNEGLPITVLQAMSYQIPVLVSTIPEHLEIIRDPQALFIENNINEMEKCIKNFLARDTKEHEKMAKDNIAIIDKQYTWDVIVPRIEQLYKRVLLSRKNKLKKIVA
ncbi:MAG: glycosyl transferase family 1 [Candidatus Magasanikbacteria bacterium CG_4_10_14_0_2_um_filter_33_14]|uniref:Glycosyl transferase family 1 n=1 Tax=Candidatus Magasanikbacteria bacterium CG_4_10_14_0_2_um_filter_33_14 TaxID=1974636 RepID=A0A2M7VAQ9_9BACT|nr:MAG: glycosyl transferase family 1 [Candidatus Magasanikbacteria bacterium CG_4_10_14_0_2_um_filter_33_14]